MKPSSPSTHWPAAIIALAVVFLAGLGFSLYWGITRTSGVSDPAYYTRGKGYGDRMQAEQAAGGWRLEVERRGEEFTLVLTNGDGAPLAGLQGSITVLAGDGTAAARQPLVPGAVPGEYHAPWPPVPSGGARAVVELEDEGAVLRRSLLLNP